MKVKNIVDVFVFLGGIIASALGGFDFPLFLLAMFILADYGFGVYIAFVLHKSPKTESGKMSSSVGWHGLFKKFMIFVIVGLMYGLDLLFNIHYLRTGTILAYMFNEGVSIVENLIIMECYVPDIVKHGIDLLDKGGEEDED